MAKGCENVTARCETVCSPSWSIPRHRLTTTAVSGSCDPQPPIARSRVGSAQTGAPIFSLPFDRSLAPQHDADSMRIRRFALSWRGNLSFNRVEQIHRAHDLYREIRSRVLHGCVWQMGHVKL